LDRLAEQIADGNVAGVVSSVAERLVRGEIDLIKRHL
jgi:hypothetical protein